MYLIIQINEYFYGKFLLKKNGILAPSKYRLLVWLVFVYVMPDLVESCFTSERGKWWDLAWVWVRWKIIKFNLFTNYVFCKINENFVIRIWAAFKWCFSNYYHWHYPKYWRCYHHLDWRAIVYDWAHTKSTTQICRYSTFHRRRWKMLR